MSDAPTTQPPSPDPAPVPARDGTSTAALALGVAALATSVIPYAVMLAMPMAVVAVVLGVVSRRTGHRSHATAGVVTGVLAIVVSLLWAALMFRPYSGMFGFSAEERVTSFAEVGSDTVEVEARRSPPPDDAGPTDAPPTFESSPPDDEPDLEGRGRAEVTGFTFTDALSMELDVCRFPSPRAGRFGDGGPSRTFSGHGPDGGVVVTFTGSTVTVVLTPADAEAVVAEGTRRGGGFSSGGGLRDRRRLTVQGEFRLPLQDLAVVAGEVELTCR